MRKVDFVVTKYYAVPEEYVTGAKEMAKWYAKEGMQDKVNKVLSLIASIRQDGTAEGRTYGILKAYSNRFNNLLVA